MLSLVDPLDVHLKKYSRNVSYHISGLEMHLLSYVIVDAPHTRCNQLIKIIHQPG